MAAHHKWGERSLRERETLDPQLQMIVDLALTHFPHDLTIIEGYRSNERQAELLRTGMSKLGPGESKHNTFPSKAVDIAPLINGKIEWENRELWMQFSGFIRGLGASMAIPLRSGVDWNNDYMSKDHSFFDGPHFELVTI